MTSIRFGLPMRQWQRECAALRARFLVLALHRRAGKTEFALKRMLDAAVKTDHDLPHYFYVAPYLKQAKIIAWARLKQMVTPLLMTGHAEINEGELYVRLIHNGAVIRVFGADNPDAMRGVRLDGAVLDEVAQMKPEVWEEIIQPALSDRKGWALFIGTPKGINLFSQLFAEATSLRDWARARYTVYDTDAIDKDEVERLRESMSESAFAREYLCDFAAAGEDQLLSLTDVETAAHRELAPGSQDGLPLVLGVDPARFGDDRSVIVARRGLHMYPPIVLRGLDQMELAARLVSEIDRQHPQAVFIDSGMGAGVIDRTRQLGYSCTEVPFGGKAVDQRYCNRRAEMWCEMAEWVRAGGSIPNDMALKTELATPTYSFDAAGHIKLESKDEIKKRLPGNGSPDIADALALTFALPVRPVDPVEAARSRNGCNDRRSYNPLDTYGKLR